ncbi:MAG: hypothetical protein DWQ07_15905 [Chloroflexi bacterium]|nr:MAG: hypothetical protein DWQ07_15905 [Chloroflexota bacterium]MBL1195235.1 hypothetical protein [Chloroflexota bacterium]NOH12520.1 hypothetical protein [Chloroflexota bacterium]
MIPKKFPFLFILLTTLMLSACALFSAAEPLPVPLEEAAAEDEGIEPSSWTLNVNIPVSKFDTMVTETSDVVYEGSFDVWPDGSISGSGVGHFEGRFTCVNIEEEDEPTYGPGELGGAFVFEIMGRLLYASEANLVKQEGDIELTLLETPSDIELAPLVDGQTPLVDAATGGYYARISTPLLEERPSVTVDFGRENCGITGQIMISEFVSWGWIPWLQGQENPTPDAFVIVKLVSGFEDTLISVVDYVADATVSIDAAESDP